MITTDASGKLEDWLVVGYTRREFAETALAAVKNWKFTPARLRGEPVGTTVDLHFHFAAEGVVVSSVSLNDSIEAEMARVFGVRYEYKLCSLRNLDRVPEPVTVVAPLYPKQLADRGE